MNDNPAANDRNINIKKCVAGICLAGAMVGAWAQGILVTPPPKSAGPFNTLSAAAEIAGLKACKAAIDRLSSLAIQGTQANEVLLDWDRKRPATSPMFSLTGLEFGNGGAAMSITTVPESAGGCSVAAERISVAPFNCQSIAAQELPGYRATRLLKTLTVYSDPKEGNSTVSLIDAPPGCLVIRRYVEFGWKPPR